MLRIHIGCLLCMANCLPLWGLDALCISNMREQYNQVMTQLHKKDLKEVPQSITVEKKYTYVPQHIIEDVAQATNLIEERDVFDQYFSKPDENGETEYSRIRKDATISHGPERAESMQPARFTIPRKHAPPLTPYVETPQEGTHILQNIGFKRIFDLTRNRSMHATCYENAALGITIDAIDAPSHTRRTWNVPSHVNTRFNCIRMGYMGNAHTYQQATRYIDELATSYNITSYEDTRSTAMLMQNRLEQTP